MKGSYVLILEIKPLKTVSIGKLGKIKFKGVYAYVGSALNSIEARVRRHLTKKKRKFWHIDYLTALKECKVKAVYFSNQKECKIAREISKVAEAVKGFGCSDCSCAVSYTHLTLPTKA